MSGVEKSRFIPEESGRLVTAFLERFFERYVSYDYTAELEEELDDVSGGRARLAEVARGILARLQAQGRRGHGAEAVRDHRGARRVPRALAVSAARRRQRPARLPGMRQRPAVAARRQVRRVRRLLQLSRLQLHPEVRPGRRGQARARARQELGDGHRAARPGASGPIVERGRSKRASIPKDVPVEDVTAEMAERLLSLPREIGAHPGDRQADHRLDRPLRALSRP